MQRFDQFMESALFDPEQGYYSRNIKTVGGKGSDFSTTATISNLLGKALAAKILDWICEESVKTIHLIEIGAGDGSLAKSILQHTPWWTRRRVNYHIVESSPPLILKQKNLLGNKPQWWNEVSEALEYAQGQAFLFSNELVDAFPARIFRNSGDSIDELHLQGTKEVFLANENPPNSSSLVNPPLHERREVHESYHQWLRSWAHLWKKGRMITIDYGDLYPKVYYRRPYGSIRSYFMHQHLTGQSIYSNKGYQDITCDVNFTDLIEWSERLGIKTEACVSQRQFLLPFSSESDADNFLLSEHGAGSAFRVLLQRRN